MKIKKYSGKAQEKYNNCSQEEKEKKRQYHGDRNKNLSEEEKQKKIEHMRDYHLAHQKVFLGFCKIGWKLRICSTNFNT